MWHQIVFLFYIIFIYSVQCRPFPFEDTSEVPETLHENDDMTKVISLTFLKNNPHQHVDAQLPLIRRKRQGKFTEAANVSNMKVMHMYLTMFSNLVGSTYVGAPHPFHPNVAKHAVKLLRDGVLNFFFPPPKEEDDDI